MLIFRFFSHLGLLNFRFPYCIQLYIFLYTYMKYRWFVNVVFWPSARANMPFQSDAPEGSDTFQWPVIERDRVGGLRLIIWDKVKVRLCHYRVMHRKRVTCELHDSYFHLMTIKHAIPKIGGRLSGRELLYNSVKTEVRQLELQLELLIRCGRESHTRP